MASCSKDSGQLDRVMTFHHYSAMFALEDVFFEIVSPEVLQYTYLIQVTRDFGTPFNFTLRGARLVPADPSFACGPLANCDDIEGGVAFVQRGDCPFVEKAMNAQLCGARAVLVFDDDPENVEHFIEMTSESKTMHPTIPAAFLLGKNGYVIMETLQRLRLSHAVINIPINASMYHIHERKQPPWVLW
ncbi:PRADC1-like protein isoform X2 [Amphibalanus amphitrite]|nr:PRADC1-like protein isoform X2 [Amphibalanus amphitrite]XP_043207778.1 PRADC1-like protein isoform X2 [Amphibalanus amphitrite]XP_043208773.1 PRADC1-like protein isoform X2 [Amphibalanus amphitrite]XP_043208774.1 PRADC1-like protein isoform X2 [Amphibalanus amphitrite]